MRAKIIFKSVLLIFIPSLMFSAKAPDFVVTDFNNKVHKLYDDYLNKDKVVVIKFFFVGCPPCATVAPYFQQSYVKWGSGTGRVQFFEITTQNDNNSLVKSYHQTKGFTFPGIGSDGGAQAARSPYTSGTFGPFYGTPTFVVIDPKGEVRFNVPFTTSNQSQLDSAIAQSLRVTNGGGGCSNAFSVKTITQIQPETYYIVDLLNGNPANEIKSGNYNCEFTLPSNIDGHYVIPQVNATADPAIGISTADVVYIQRKILGLQTFNNLQLAVADVNNSNTVSAADISEIRKLILGITNKFSKLTKTFVVVHNPKSVNPFDLTDRVLVKDLVSKLKINEFGIGKYGDVTGANLYSNEELTTRSKESITWNVEIKKLQNGRYEHRIYAERSFFLSAFQCEFSLDKSEFTALVPSPKFSGDNGLNYHVLPGSIKILNATNQDVELLSGETWFSIITKTPEPLKIHSGNEMQFELLMDNMHSGYAQLNLEYPDGYSNSNGIKILENPDYLIFQHSGSAINALAIYNLNGMKIDEMPGTGNLNIIECNKSALNPGIYFARIHLSNGFTKTAKFVIPAR